MIGSAIVTDFKWQRDGMRIGDPDSKHKDLKETFTIERMIPRERSTSAR
jgi:hypothetical protein